MKKYKELLKKIICERLNIADQDDLKILDYNFANLGVNVIYQRYIYNWEENKIYIFNSELNAYMYENLN